MIVDSDKFDGYSSPEPCLKIIFFDDVFSIIIKQFFTGIEAGDFIMASTILSDFGTTTIKESFENQGISRPTSTIYVM